MQLEVKVEGMMCDGCRCVDLNPPVGSHAFIIWLCCGCGKMRRRRTVVVEHPCHAMGHGCHQARGNHALARTNVRPNTTVACTTYCSSRVEGVLREMAGVASVTVDLDAKLARIAVAAASAQEATAMLPTFVNTINELGFEAEAASK